MTQITPELLASVAGALLALAFAYIPKVKEWFDALDSPSKAGLMALMLVIVSVGVFASGCAQVFAISIACTKQGAVDLLVILFNALVANQSIYLVAVRPFKK